MIFLLDYVEMWITFPPPFSYPKNKQILENWLIKLCTFNVAKYVHNYQNAHKFDSYEHILPH